MQVKYQAPAVQKAFQILKLIADAPHGLGISDLAKKLGISKGTIHGITAALEDLQVIVRDPATKRYGLGLTLFELGRAVYSKIDLKDMARPVMEQLMEKTQESVFLGISNGTHVTIIDIAVPHQELKITSPIGTTLPLLAGAVGKILLAGMEPQKAEEMIRQKGLQRYTIHTDTAPQTYLQELEQVRRDGFATDDEGYILGVRAVAAPISGSPHPFSAIWVVGFKASLDDEKMKLLGSDTKQAADTISQKIRAKSFA